MISESLRMLVYTFLVVLKSVRDHVYLSFGECLNPQNWMLCLHIILLTIFNHFRCQYRYYINVPRKHVNLIYYSIL